ncbi:hypothetical protein ABID41_001580 [Phenylobacterium koreense]|uniref:Uncharacterized protein n=1 Tax=Phenylobacterium koreense TaxID=266125 RepID=A0ABV2EHH3_9CAUL
MNSPRRTPLRFTRGGRVYIIAPATGANDTGYMGLCDGQVVARGEDRAFVMRELIDTDREYCASLAWYETT